MVPLSRDRAPSQAQIVAGADLEDRKVVGYLGFYQEVFDLLEDMRRDHAVTYGKYQQMTRSWICEARFVFSSLKFKGGSLILIVE